MLTLIKISDTDQGSLHSDLKIGLKLLLEFYLDLTQPKPVPGAGDMCSSHVRLC